MGKIAVQNTTGMPIYIGSEMIAPGDSRLFDEAQVPEHLRPAPQVDATPPVLYESDEAREAALAAGADEQAKAAAAAAEREKVLIDLLAQSVDRIKTELPGLPLADVEKLGELEQTAPAPRRTLLEALSARILELQAGA